jgi:hypothetical protein
MVVLGRLPTRRLAVVSDTLTIGPRQVLRWNSEKRVLLGVRPEISYGGETMRLPRWRDTSWSGRTKARRAAIVAVLGVSTGLVGCGGDPDPKSPAAQSGAKQTANEPVAETATPTPKPDVRVDFKGPFSAHQDLVTLRGSVSPKSAKVRIRGQRATVKNGHWSLQVTLKHGTNDFRVRATRSGFTADRTNASVDRRLSAAEKAIIAAAKVQDFKASAITIPYNQLNKNADRYKGDKVVYRGQILQIQEDGDSGGVILLSVTDEGYDIWDDNVWVDYEHSINSADEDIITVYGTVKGSKSYETQIGGETYVPQIKARYIVE